MLGLGLGLRQSLDPNLTLALALTRYGLVVWLRAETSEALAADLRALVTDHGVGVQGLRNEEVVAEVRRDMREIHGRYTGDIVEIRGGRGRGALAPIPTPTYPYPYPYPYPLPQGALAPLPYAMAVAARLR